MLKKVETCRLIWILFTTFSTAFSKPLVVIPSFVQRSNIFKFKNKQERNITVIPCDESAYTLNQRDWDLL